MTSMLSWSPKIKYTSTRQQSQVMRCLLLLSCVMTVYCFQIGRLSPQDRCQILLQQLRGQKAIRTSKRLYRLFDEVDVDEVEENEQSDTSLICNDQGDGKNSSKNNYRNNNYKRKNRMRSMMKILDPFVTTDGWTSLTGEGKLSRGAARDRVHNAISSSRRRFRKNKNEKRAKGDAEIALKKMQAPIMISVNEACNLRDESKSGKSLSRRKKSSKTSIVTVRSVHELRTAVLDQGIELKDIVVEANYPLTNYSSESVAHEPTYHASTLGKASNNKENKSQLFHHEVLTLMAKRVATNSKPSNRDPTDTAVLALSIEGGGMRGAVSAGMGSAIGCLGLCDAFDVVYGASAGSVVGAYLVSRQMCVDVYTDLLTAAKTTFVSKSRLIYSIMRSVFGSAFSQATLRNSALLGLTPLMSSSGKNITPGMNVSFVLDGIMSPELGLRPLDIKCFMENDRVQPLRIVASTVRKGKMETVCLGSKDIDFFDEIDVNTGKVKNFATTSTDGKRHGLFACLETSMTVPAATGPPRDLIRNKDIQANATSTCFDAFCYEPLPYRSAVEEGATHVLMLRSRPDGCAVKTKLGIFEKLIAPLYFIENKLPQVAKYFERGGQLYVYLEDILTLNEGRTTSVNGDFAGKDSSKGVLIPPTKLLYGVDRDDEVNFTINNRRHWKRAHLLPVTLPQGTPELATLSTDREEVLQAVRQGFAAAFDLLAPVAGVELPNGFNGTRVAELVFPRIAAANSALLKQVEVCGEPILSGIDPSFNVRSLSGIKLNRKRLLKRYRISRWANKGRMLLRKTGVIQEQRKNDELANRPEVSDASLGHDILQNSDIFFGDCSTDPCPRRDAKKLLAQLPGLQSGKMSTLATGLRHTRGYV